MELSILQVSGSFHFVELNGKKYILDNTTITPKSYFWGVRTEFITVDLSESYDNDTLLRVQKNNLGIPVIVLMTLPIVNLMYSFLESLFSNYTIGQNFFLKLRNSSLSRTKFLQVYHWQGTQFIKNVELTPT